MSGEGDMAKGGGGRGERRVDGGRVGSELRGGGNALLMDEVDMHTSPCSDGVLLAISGAFLPDMVIDAGN